MPLELVNTLASIATFVVIAATAVAAVIQLRHIRHGNELQTIMALRTLRESDLIEEAFEFVAKELPERLEDPKFRAELEMPKPPDRKVHKELVLWDYFEHVGSYIKFGLIDPELYLDFANPERYWNLCAPAMAIYRRKRGRQAYENYEYLVTLSQDWDKRHAGGFYPPGARRLEIPDPYLEADRMQ